MLITAMFFTLIFTYGSLKIAGNVLSNLTTSEAGVNISEDENPHNHFHSHGVYSHSHNHDGALHHNSGH